MHQRRPTVESLTAETSRISVVEDRSLCQSVVYFGQTWPRKEKEEEEEEEELKELIFIILELDLSLFHLLYPLLSVSHQLNSLAYSSKITLNVIFILSIL